MSDNVIGEGKIKVSVDASGAEAGLNTASRSIENYIKKIQAQASNVNKTTAEIKLQELAQRGATQAQLDAAAAAFKTIESYKQQQAEARKAAAASEVAAAAIARAQNQASNLANRNLTRYQAQQLSFQLNDLFVQIASGQSPITALIQQGSQLNGTFGGFRGTLQAIASLLTPVRLAIGGIAALIGTVGAAFYLGQQQSEDFNKAMIATGGIAGITEDNFKSLASQIAKSSHETVGNVRDMASALIKTGSVPQEVFSQATAAAVAYAKITGKTADDVGSDFRRMTEDPRAFAKEVNKSLNLLSTTQLDTIKQFSDNGRAADALGIIYSALTDRGDRLNQNLSTTSKLLQEGKEWFSRFWTAAKDEFGPQTIEQQLKRVQGAIENANKQISSGLSTGDTSSLESRRLEISKSFLREQENNTAQSLDKLANKEAEATKPVIEGWLKKAKSASAYKEELDKVKAAIQKQAFNGTPVSDKDQQAIFAAVKKEFTDKDGLSEAKARAAELAEEIKAAYDAQVKAAQNAEQLLEASRSAGLIGEEDYYNAKRSLLNNETDTQVESLTKQRAVFEALKLSGKDAFDNKKKIVDINKQIAETEASAATKTAILNLQQRTTIRQIENAWNEARQSAQEYLDILKRGQDRDLASTGLGDRQREQIAQRNAIADDYARQRIQLESQKQLLEGLGAFNADEQAKYQQRLAIINDFQSKALASFDDYYARRREQDNDASIGASRALQNYYDSARNVMSQTENIVTDSLSGAEDALVKFSQTGKLTFSGLVNSIVGDFSRIGWKNLIANGMDFARGGGFGDVIGSFASRMFAPPVATATNQTTAEAVRLGLSASDAGAIGTISSASTAFASASTASTTAIYGLSSAASTAAAALSTIAATSAGRGAETLVGAAASAFGGAGSVAYLPDLLRGGRAIGGPVSSGGLYPINEMGRPEVLDVAGKQYLMMGNQSGSVKPSAVSSDGPVQVTINQYYGPGTDRRTVSQGAVDAGRAVQRALSRNG